MAIDRATLTWIVNESSTMAERIGGAFDPVAGENLDADTRLAAWRLAIAQGDNTRFARRLSWDALTIDSARALLGRVERRADVPLPSWSSILADASTDALALAAEIDEDARVDSACDRVIHDKAPVAFEELLVPFVRAARRQLHENSNCNSGEVLSDRALGDIEWALLGHLSGTAEQVLTIELQAYRALRPTRLTDILGAVAHQTRPAYAAFVRDHLSNGLSVIARRYPVLARLLAEGVETWLRTTTALLARLAADAHLVRSELAGGEEILPITHIVPNLSDRHRGGQTVSILTSACGRLIVYKPRTLDLESAFSRLLEWLNAQDADALPFRVMKVIDRDDYGWEEYVSVQPCTDVQEAERYYERAGMIVCLAYVLGGADLHCGNLVAAGEHPILIDLEMLMCAAIGGADGAESVTTAHAQRDTWQSVLRTSLIPVRSPVDFGQGQSVYGLASMSPGATITQMSWEHVNTDLMVRRAVTSAAGPRGNVPTLNGVEVSATDHSAAIERGLRTMYVTLMRHREQLVAPDGPLASFERGLVRVLMRPTIVYERLLGQSTHPSFLRNGADRSIMLERHLSPLTRVPTASRLLALWIRERDQLESLDYPLFFHRADGTSIFAWPATEGTNTVVESGYAGTLARLARLDQQDMDAQAHAIRLGFGTREMSATATDPRRARGLAAAGSLPALTAELALEEAETIARDMDRRAVESRDAGPSWVALFDARGTSTKFPLKPLGASMFDGQAGIGLFYAALYRITGKPAHRDRASAIYRPIVMTLGDDAHRARLASSMSIGGGAGLGSIVYAITRAAALLSQPELLAVAGAAAREITPDRITSDSQLDIMFGAAGAALGLLALHRATNDAEHLDRVRLCGAHLLAHRTHDDDSKLLAWRTLGGRHTTSFSHGSAGIGYALLELHSATGDPAFLDAALESRAFEDSLFLPTERNWREQALLPDERS
ncbi:MAG: type 2 lanthipeptide synthetase LanM, partial [bacterium]